MLSLRICACRKSAGLPAAVMAICCGSMACHVLIWIRKRTPLTCIYHEDENDERIRKVDQALLSHVIKSSTTFSLEQLLTQTCSECADFPVNVSLVYALFFDGLFGGCYLTLAALDLFHFLMLDLPIAKAMSISWSVQNRLQAANDTVT